MFMIHKYSHLAKCFYSNSMIDNERRDHQSRVTSNVQRENGKNE